MAEWATHLEMSLMDECKWRSRSEGSTAPDHPPKPVLSARPRECHALPGRNYTTRPKSSVGHVVPIFAFLRFLRESRHSFPKVETPGFPRNDSRNPFF